MQHDKANSIPRGNNAVLHLLCGRIAAGKSTLAKSLARRHNAVLISEDAYLSALLTDPIQNFQDYQNYSQRFQALIKPTCLDMLERGNPVVLDFPANSPSSRQWLKELIAHTNVRHLLHYLTASNQECWQQFQQRKQTHGANASPIADGAFEEINHYFEPPDVTEGFNVEINR